MNDPDVLVMDEPFAALDYQVRLLMGRFLLDVWSKFRKTIIFATHSIDEAILLCDKVIVMSASPGRVLDEVMITSPRPRDLTSSESNEYRSRLTKHIEREVLQSFSQQNH